MFSCRVSIYYSNIHISTFRASQISSSPHNVVWQSKKKLINSLHKDTVNIHLTFYNGYHLIQGLALPRGF